VRGYGKAKQRTHTDTYQCVAELAHRGVRDANVAQAVEGDQGNTRKGESR